MVAARPVTSDTPPSHRPAWLRPRLPSAGQIAFLRLAALRLSRPPFNGLVPFLAKIPVLTKILSPSLAYFHPDSVAEPPNRDARLPGGLSNADLALAWRSTWEDRQRMGSSPERTGQRRKRGGCVRGSALPSEALRHNQGRFLLGIGLDLGGVGSEEVSTRFSDRVACQSGRRRWEPQDGYPGRGEYRRADCSLHQFERFSAPHSVLRVAR